MSRRAPLVAGALAVVAVGVLLALAVGRTGSPPDGQPAAGDRSHVGMAHVHGLGIDPGDGTLLAGTHFGAFRVADDGRAEQVGPVQDYMGFTVIGPGHYLASGHPGADQDAPANLGLLESTDGGRTWTTLSLAGEADFHTLEARHGRVYGHSAGQLMVSGDKKTWDRRAAIPLADLAVSPDDPDTLLATTQEGLVVSRDGGRTFRSVADAPLLALITWTEGGTLYGVDPVGTVHSSEDGGDSWTARGGAGGGPAAVTATDDRLLVATVDGVIAESADGGATFTARYQPHGQD